MKQFNVTGMSCAACSARVEKAVQKVPGVTACSVSLLTHSMGVEGTAEDAAGGPRSPRFEKTPVVVAGFSDRIDVFFYGPYDVGLAAALLLYG